MEGVRPRSEVRQAALRPGGPAGPRSARRGSSSEGAGNLTGPGSGCGPRTGHGVRVEWWLVGEGRSRTVPDGRAAAAPAPLGLRLWACELACLWEEKREDEAGDQVEPDRYLSFLLGAG